MMIGGVWRGSRTSTRQNEAKFQKHLIYTFEVRSVRSVGALGASRGTLGSISIG